MKKILRVHVITIDTVVHHASVSNLLRTMIKCSMGHRPFSMASVLKPTPTNTPGPAALTKSVYPLSNGLGWALGRGQELFGMSSDRKGSSSGFTYVILMSHNSPNPGG